MLWFQWIFQILCPRSLVLDFGYAFELELIVVGYVRNKKSELFCPELQLDQTLLIQPIDVLNIWLSLGCLSFSTESFTSSSAKNHL